MTYQIDDTIYTVEIEKKHNKNTYIRIKPGNIIYVTTSYFTTQKQIKKLLIDNHSALVRMHSRLKRQEEKKAKFYYLGEVYDIIIVPTMKNIEVIEHNIYTPSISALEKWLLKKCRVLFLEKLDEYWNKMEEDIPYPKLKLRKMKTRWGVCNKKNTTITLNTELIHYNICCLEYVVVHELSHFVHFNHSKDFWDLVEKYCSNYKEIRKILKG